MSAFSPIDKSLVAPASMQSSARRPLLILYSCLLGLLLACSLLLILQPQNPAAAAPATTRTFPGAAPCNTTLQACINGSSAGDTINIQPGLYNNTSVTLNKAVSLIGAGASSTILQASPGQRVLNVTAVMNAPTQISDLTIQGGNAGLGTGGGIFLASGAQPIIQNVIVNGNSGVSGGGIFASSPITLTNVSLTANSATNGNGGGMYAASNVYASNCTIQANTVITNGYGGGILAAGNFVGTNVNFIANSVTNGYDGGGLYVSGSVTLTGGQFTSNRTTKYKGYGGGGGLMAFGRANITGTQFKGNLSADWGGGAYLAYFANVAPSNLTNVQFSNNKAQGGGGGGLFMWFDSVLTNVDFYTNTATYRGGGIYAGYAGNYLVSIQGGQYISNTASGGGGLYSDSQIAITNTQFLKNTSLSDNGGGAWTTLTANVKGARFEHNTVVSGGNSGGLDTLGDVRIADTVFLDNRALTGAGGGSGARAAV